MIPQNILFNFKTENTLFIILPHKIDNVYQRNMRVSIHVSLLIN